MLPAEDGIAGGPPAAPEPPLRPVPADGREFDDLVASAARRVKVLLRPLLIEDISPKDDGLNEALEALADLVEHIEDVELITSRRAKDKRGPKLRKLQQFAEDAALDLRELRGGVSRERRKDGRARANEFLRYLRDSGLAR